MNDVKFTISAVDKSAAVLANAKKGIADLGGGVKSLLGQFGLALGGVAAFGAAVTLIFRESIEAQNALVQLTNAVAVTGGVAGKSVGQLVAMSKAMQENSIFSDEAAMSAERALLSFTKVRGPNFDEALKLSADLAIRMGTDLPNAAQMMGRALESPQKGLRALAASGATFTAGQMKVIQHMYDTGRAAEAQRLILERLQGVIGGSSAAAVSTLGGALAKLKNNFFDLFEVSKDSPLGQTMINGVNGLSKSVKTLADNMNLVVSALKLIGVALAINLGAKAVTTIMAIVLNTTKATTEFGILAKTITKFGLVEGSIKYITMSMNYLNGSLVTLQGGFAAAQASGMSMATFLKTAFTAIVTTIGLAVAAILVWKQVIDELFNLISDRYEQAELDRQDAVMASQTTIDRLNRGRAPGAQLGPRVSQNYANIISEAQTNKRRRTAAATTPGIPGGTDTFAADLDRLRQRTAAQLAMNNAFGASEFELARVALSTERLEALHANGLKYSGDRLARMNAETDAMVLQRYAALRLTEELRLQNQAIENGTLLAQAETAAREYDISVREADRQQLMDELSAMPQIQPINFDNMLATIGPQIDNMWEKLGFAGLTQTNSPFYTQLSEGMGNAIGESLYNGFRIGFSKIGTFRSFVNGFFASMANVLSGAMQTLSNTLLKEGVKMILVQAKLYTLFGSIISALKKAITNPILAGFALVGIGVALSALAGKLGNEASYAQNQAYSSGAMTNSYDTLNTQGQDKVVNIYIEGGFINTNDPVQARQLGQAIEQLSQRRVLFVNQSGTISTSKV